MAQWAKCLSQKPDSLSSTPKPPKGERTNPIQLSSDSVVCWSAYAHKRTLMVIMF